jgi:hypothetical protein
VVDTYVAPADGIPFARCKYGLTSAIFKTILLSRKAKRPGISGRFAF